VTIQSRLIGSAALGLLALCALRLDAQQPRTVWDGLYTEEQAARGDVLYADRCARCHGDTLAGMEAAPALTGTAFYSNWEGEPLEALFERMRSSMPQDKPGSLSRAQNADLLAHMLRVGGYPAGTTALDGQAGALAQVTIRMYRP
jgi:mono/diheme cytochrome c family protein